MLFSALLLVTLSSCAKKVKVTIDGTLSPTQKTLWLIINEDTANAQLIPIQDAKFSVTVKVDNEAYIRLHDWKEWPERSAFVLIPDSKHITIDWRTGSIEGSFASKRLKAACDMVKREGPGNFHIDVFSDDKEAWAEARAKERAIRLQMEQRQRDVFRQLVIDNRYNEIPAWLVYCYPEFVTPDLMAEVTREIEPEWMSHPILKKKQ